MLFSTGIFDQVVPNKPQAHLPLRLTLTPDGGRTTARLLLIVPVLAVLLVPAAIAAALLLSADPGALARHDGLTHLALAAMPVAWLGLLVLALLAMVPRLGSTRIVSVSGDTVSVLDKSLLSTRSWRLPIHGYRGIAHHVRATAGVVSHEIILVHEKPSRSVLLHTAPMVAQASLDHYCALLRLPLVASREVYRLGLARNLGRASLAGGALGGQLSHPLAPRPVRGPFVAALRDLSVGRRAALKPVRPQPRPPLASQQQAA